MLCAFRTKMIETQHDQLLNQKVTMTGDKYTG